MLGCHYGTYLSSSSSHTFSREAAEPAVTVSNLPESVNQAAVAELFSGFKTVRIDVLPKTKGEGKRQALVVLGGMEDVSLACTGLNKKSIGGSVVQVAETPVHDLGKSLEDSLFILGYLFVCPQHAPYTVDGI